MTPAEAVELLTLAAAFDRRTVGRTDAAAWADALDGLEVRDCAEAIRQHFRDSTDYLMPAHVRQRVRDIIRARVLAERDAATRLEIEAAHDPAASRQSFEKWVTPIIEKIAGRGLEAEQAEREARKVPCGYCKAPVGETCRVGERPRDVAHPSRYDDAAKADAS